MISVFNHISADLDASKFNVLIYHRPHTAAFKVECVVLPVNSLFFRLLEIQD